MGKHGVIFWNCQRTSDCKTDWLLWKSIHLFLEIFFLISGIRKSVDCIEVEMFDIFWNCVICKTDSWQDHFCLRPIQLFLRMFFLPGISKLEDHWNWDVWYILKLHLCLWAVMPQNKWEEREDPPWDVKCFKQQMF